MKIELLSLNIDELKQIMVSLNQPKYRAEQIFYELHCGKTLDEMSNIPKDLKSALKENYEDQPVSIFKVQKSSDGTQKFLFKLSDENVVEGVLMSYKFGYSLCVSSQVGCRMGCKFCASGIDGLIRNLSIGEILGQIVVANKYLNGDVKERKITNIVLMGSGEPLDNYDNLLKFLSLATNKFGLYFSERNISISTCGLVPKIYELADSGFKINLCLSLHASNDKTRNELMPVSKGFRISELISACIYYFEKTNRRVLFEYVLIEGYNCSLKNAQELSKLLKGLNCMVNLINLNEVKENNLKKCSPETASAFAKILKENGINVTTRRSLGNDIDGACGQLRRRYINKEI